MPINLHILRTLASEDVEQLAHKNQSYADSWCKRGGQDSFFMLARKWDRIEEICRQHDNNILHACRHNTGDILDDIGDLRRYLLLVEMKIKDEDRDPYRATQERELQRERLETAKDDLYGVETDGDDGRHDDDPNPYHGDYSEE